MCATSINTFVRAYKAPAGSTAKAAGDYENTSSTKNIKKFLGLISFGIFYGIAELIEHFANVKPKIHEFARLNCDLHNAIVNRQRDSDGVLLKTESGQELTLYEQDDRVHVYTGGVGIALELASFKEVLTRISADRQANPGYYAGLEFARRIIA